MKKKATDLFDKLDSFTKVADDLNLQELNPLSIAMEEVLSPTEAMIDGRHTILAGTNNYLGLTFDPRCIGAAHEALDNQGTGTTGSRAANGTYSGHQNLERTISEFYGTDHAIVFSTGFLANLAMISTLTGRGDYILLDADCHASIYDGCMLSGATVVRFRHNSPEDLDKRLRRLGTEGSNVLVIVEGLYSMLGDLAPLKELVQVTKKHNAYILVDEAHSMGVFGENGEGVSHAEGIQDNVDFIVGTFSKSVGTVGGFCASNHPKFEILRFAARPYMFTASLPPSVVASANEAIKIIQSEPDLRDQLWQNAKQLYAGLEAAGFDLGASCSPIIAVKMPDKETAAALWEKLMLGGIYVNLAIPPATPQALSLLRCSLSAAHTREQINKIIAAFVDVAAEAALFSKPVA